MSEKRTILAIFAHPDDEVFGVGGALAHYAAAGDHVVLVCATYGEAGEIAAPALATPETLGEVRANELRCAASRLGVEDIVFLGYRDSGMAGTVENKDPRAFINAPQQEVVSRLAAVMRQWQPHAVITFDPNGGYGHPDHVAIHRHTLSAFERLDVEQARLFYTVVPRSFFVEMRRRMVERGVDTSQLDRFEEIGAAGWPDGEVHAGIDVAATVDAKLAAFHCHRTQFGTENPFFQLPPSELKELMRYEHFFLARPAAPPDLHLDDLFGPLTTQ